MPPSLDRRLEQIEALTFERTVEAARQEAEAAVQRRVTIPGYADLMDALWDLVEASDAIPPDSWRDDATTKVVIASLEAWREEEGMPETTPERIDEWRTTLYRWRVVTETPAGREILRRQDALIEGCSSGEYQ